MCQLTTDYRAEYQRVLYSKLARKFAFAWQGLTETSNRQETASVVNISSRTPLGVAGLISPWNLPLYLLTFKIAPAIMSGGVRDKLRDQYYFTSDF